MRHMLCAAFLLLAISSSATDKTIPVETIQSVKRSIVPIVCAYMDEKSAFKIVEIAGTGFFVDTSGRFVTAGHVLDNWENISKTRHQCAPAIYIPDHGWKQYEFNIPFQYFWFIQCYRETSVDLAVCRAPENPFTSQRVKSANIAPVSFATSEVPDGTPVGFTGFPLEQVAPFTSQGIIAGHIGIGSIPANFDYIIDKPNWPGASGSPVYLQSGEVIGIILMRGLSDAAGLGVARSAAVIVDFLSREHSKKK